MIQQQNQKMISLVPPAAIVNNAAVTVASLDTLGFEYVRIVVYLGATDIALTVLKVGESDTDGSYTDITGLRFGTDNNIAGSASTLPSSTDDNKIFEFQIDMRGIKRFLKLAITVGVGTLGAFVTAWAELGRPQTIPIGAAGFGASQVMRVPAST